MVALPYLFAPLYWTGYSTDERRAGDSGGWRLSESAVDTSSGTVLFISRSSLPTCAEPKLETSSWRIDLRTLIEFLLISAHFVD